MNMNDIEGFDAMAEEIREVYIERDRLRDELEALRQFKTDICEVLGIGGNSHNDGVVKLLKANKARTSMDADDNRMYRDILDEIKKYFKMTASHWTYSDIPHFVKTAHEFALEKKEYMEDAMRGFCVDICKELGVNYEMSTKTSILSEIKRLRESVNKQEEFTEEAADILGVHPGDLSLSDVLEALRNLKRYEDLNDMNCEIIADLRAELYRSKKAFSGEHSRRLAAEKYISDTFQRAAKELGMTRIPDGIDKLCDEIADLRNYRNRISCPKEFWEAICGVMEMDPTDATPSDVIAKTKETKKRLISILVLDPDAATWTDIYDDIEAQQKDHCNLISESYNMKNELEELKKKSEDNKQSFVFSSVCDYLGIAADDATLSDIHKEIEKLKSWKTVAADHDKRRKHWVRKYKSEHERANSCDELYREWKDKYEAYYKKTSDMAEQNETLMASYMAVKNTAIKQKDILKVVCRYLAGKDTMPDKDIVVRLNEMWTKEIGWDGLAKHYGKKAIGELIDACDDEITETTRKDLGDMLST